MQIYTLHLDNRRIIIGLVSKLNEDLSVKTPVILNTWLVHEMAHLLECLHNERLFIYGQVFAKLEEYQGGVKQTGF